VKRRTIREAAIEALKRYGKPMSSKDIYAYIVKHDLYRFNAENPLNIVNGEIRRHCVGIDFPTAKADKDFQLLIDGTYWIKDLNVPGQTNAANKSEKIVRKDSESLKEIVSELKAIHNKHNEAFKKQILSQLKEIPPQTFEVFAKRLLEVYGFIDMEVTSYVKDGGIDGHGKLKVGITFLNVAFQCKRWSTNSVSRTEIDKFRGAIQGSFEQGIIFTTSNFSKEALNATRRNGAVPIILIDGSTLVDFMIEKKFGVESENIPVYINALDNALTEDET
jgi:restriction system protein